MTWSARPTPPFTPAELAIDSGCELDEFINFEVDGDGSYGQECLQPIHHPTFFSQLVSQPCYNGEDHSTCSYSSAGEERAEDVQTPTEAKKKNGGVKAWSRKLRALSCKALSMGPRVVFPAIKTQLETEADYQTSLVHIPTTPTTTFPSKSLDKVYSQVSQLVNTFEKEVEKRDKELKQLDDQFKNCYRELQHEQQALDELLPKYSQVLVCKEQLRRVSSSLEIQIAKRLKHLHQKYSPESSNDHHLKGNCQRINNKCHTDTRSKRLLSKRRSASISKGAKPFLELSSKNDFDNLKLSTPPPSATFFSPPFPSNMKDMNEQFSLHEVSPPLSPLSPTQASLQPEMESLNFQILCHSYKVDDLSKRISKGHKKAHKLEALSLFLKKVLLGKDSCGRNASSVPIASNNPFLTPSSCGTTEKVQVFPNTYSASNLIQNSPPVENLPLNISGFPDKLPPSSQYAIPYLDILPYQDITNTDPTAIFATPSPMQEKLCDNLLQLDPGWDLSTDNFFCSSKELQPQDCFNGFYSSLPTSHLPFNGGISFPEEEYVYGSTTTSGLYLSNDPIFSSKPKIDTRESLCAPPSSISGLDNRLQGFTGGKSSYPAQHESSSAAFGLSNPIRNNPLVISLSTGEGRL